MHTTVTPKKNTKKHRHIQKKSVMFLKKFFGYYQKEDARENKIHSPLEFLNTETRDSQDEGIVFENNKKGYLDFDYSI